MRRSHPLRTFIIEISIPLTSQRRVFRVNFSEFGEVIDTAAHSLLAKVKMKMLNFWIDEPPTSATSPLCELLMSDSLCTCTSGKGRKVAINTVERRFG